MSAQTKEITVRYFASLRERLGLTDERLQTQAGTMSELRHELAARGGVWAEALGADRPVRMALAQALCEGDQPLADGDEAAFFPPVTGG